MRHDLRQEPYAVAPHVRRWAGGAAGNHRPYRDRTYLGLGRRQSARFRALKSPPIAGVP
jgi:hypothetical protein